MTDTGIKLKILRKILATQLYIIPLETYFLKDQKVGCRSAASLREKDLAN